jgi:hypothetical protein
MQQSKKGSFKNKGEKYIQRLLSIILITFRIISVKELFGLNGYLPAASCGVSKKKKHYVTTK